MNFVFPFLAAAVGATEMPSSSAKMISIWSNSTGEAKAIIVLLVIFSIFAWSVMLAKALQMYKATKMNRFFDAEFHNQKNVFS
ncbi:MAG: hypothetical protein ACO1QB_11905, partial [Verrucomicrobiales bacterium]